jgi:putative transcriptional regulator
MPVDEPSEFARGLIAAAEEAVAHMQGRATGAMVHHVPDPRLIRQRAGMTQEQMAPLLGLSLSGYRKLEQGKRSVSGPAAILLRILDKDPEAVRRALAA